MKKFVPIFLFFLPFFIFAGNLEITAGSDSVLNTSFSGNNLKFSVSVKENNNGRYSVSTSPVFNYSNGSLHFGELKPTDLFSLIRNKTETTPVYTGFEFAGKNLTVFFSNPVFYPKSTKSLGISMKYDNFHGAILLSDNNTKVESSDLNYQIDWGKYKNSFQTSYVLGTSRETELFKHKFKIGFDLGNRTNSFSLGITKNSFSVSFSQTVSDTEDYVFTVDSGTFLQIKISGKTYQESKYAGTSQAATYTLDSKMSIGFFSLRSVSKVENRQDTGQFLQTEFSAELKNNQIKINIGTVFNRTKGKENKFADLSLTLESDKVYLNVKGKKASLTLKFIKETENGLVTISVNQSKTVTVGINRNF